MQSRPPKVMVTGFVTAGAHYAQIGSELAKWALRAHTPPSLAALSVFAVNLSIAMFLVRVVPVLFQGYLKLDATMASVEQRCIEWGQQRLVDGALWVVARFGQDSPRR